MSGLSKLYFSLAGRLRRHTMRKKAIICIICSLTIILSGCWLLPSRPQGEADKTANVNQAVERGEDWQRIVTDSRFQLGVKAEDISYGTGKLVEDFGTYPLIDGSTVCYPMAVEFAWQHLDLSDDDARNFCWMNTTHYAYEYLFKLEDNPYYEDLPSPDAQAKYSAPDLFLGTAPSEDELRLAEQNGIELYMQPVCYDAFVFITHKNNPVESLSVQQIQDIYSGEITNWSELGGRNSSITAFQREANSGSQTAMEELVMQGKPMIAAKMTEVPLGMGMMIDEVAEYKNSAMSIGYTYRYYIDTLYKNDNIKTIEIDGIPPDDAHIRSGSYLFTTNYFGVIRAEDKQNTGGKFLDWICSEEGQKCVEQAGYIVME